MLVHRRFPDIASVPQAEVPGRPVRTVIGDIVKRFLRATKPPARVGAGMGATALQRLARAVVWANMYVAAAAGIATLYALGKTRAFLGWAQLAVPFAVLATLIVLARAAWRMALVPFHHVALTVVAVCVGIEALLAGRVFVQLAYQDDVGGLGGSVLSLTDRLVAPFMGLEGTTPLHDTGVVEFATLTAIEAYLIATIGIVVLLMFCSEFLHMYRRVRDFFLDRAERRETSQVDAEPEQASVATADLGAAS